MKQFNAAGVALRVDVSVDAVGIDNRVDAFELVNHLVDARRERQQLNVVDKE